MARSFGLVDSKVQEAEYFLDRILYPRNGFYGVQHDAVAFTASARSITFAMQSSLTGFQEFDNWYKRKQDELRSNELARFFNDFRRISQHIGDNAVGGGIYRDGVEFFHFVPIPELPNVPDIDVASACSQYFKLTLALVYDCYIEFDTLVNGQWRFTRENYTLLGKSIQDAWESLGFSRNWSDVVDFDEETKWRYLRKQADGCNIQEQFETWLKKRLPHPDDDSD